MYDFYKQSKKTIKEASRLYLTICADPNCYSRSDQVKDQLDTLIWCLGSVIYPEARDTIDVIRLLQADESAEFKKRFAEMFD